MLASFRGHAEVVKLLVAAGADRNVQDKVSVGEGIMFVVESL
jgi:ankyrin repeat protein